MKKILILVAASFLAVGCSSNNWASKGDDLVKRGDYKGAYAAYIEGCNDSSLSDRLIACDVARDLRLNAKRAGINTSNW